MKEIIKNIIYILSSIASVLWIVWVAFGWVLNDYNTSHWNIDQRGAYVMLSVVLWVLTVIIWLQWRDLKNNWF